VSARRQGADGSRRATLPLLPRLGWRNLWRNGRRTALTAGGVAFAVFLVVTTMCIQLGSYVSMKDTATGLLTGHLQVQSAAYAADQQLEDALPRAAALAERVAAQPGVAAVAPRVEAFALASVAERSFGARILGVDPVAERRVVDFHRRIFAGRHVRRPEVEEGRARRVDLDLPAPVDVMVDGEVRKLKLKRLEVLPSALEVVA